MIVIDTNIMYSIVGISENEKVKKANNLSELELATTTATLVEIIVKHRNDLSTIQQCLDLIVREKIKLISIGHIPLSNQIIQKLNSAGNLEDIQDEIDEIVQLKIQRESEFLRWVLIIVSLGVFESLRSGAYGFKDENNNQQQLYMIRSLIEANEKLLLDYFIENIIEGYKQGNEQGAAFEAFNEMLLIFINIFNFNYHQIKTGSVPFGESGGGDSFGDKLSSSLSGDNFSMKIKKNLPNLIGIASGGSNRALIEKYVNDVSKGVSDLESVTGKSLQFIMKIIESGYINSSKIRKNDIFDFFIVFSLEINGARILTLDKKFGKLLKEVDPESYRLCVAKGFVE